MASTYIEKPYSDSAIDILLKFVEQGDKDYDIEIDEQPIVSRTDNVEHFYDFVNYINPSTQFVSIRIYKGKSRNYDRTVLLRKSNGLNGTPSEAAKNAYDNKPKFDILKEKSDLENSETVVITQSGGVVFGPTAKISATRFPFRSSSCLCQTVRIPPELIPDRHVKALEQTQFEPPATRDRGRRENSRF